MKKFLVLPVALCLFFFTSSIVHADFVSFTLTQDKSEVLKGWNIYYAVHVTDQAPDPAVTVDDYDTVVEFVGFSAANVMLPIIDRVPLNDQEWGLSIVPYPGFESTHWAVELTFYMQGTKPEENKTVYFIATATGLNGTESGISPVVPSVVEAPGQAEAPVVGYKPGTSAAPKQLPAFVLPKVPPTSGSNIPTVLSVRVGE